MNIESRAVLAGAYTSNRGRMLIHAVRVDDTGLELSVLCDRVSLDSLADRHASDPNAPPTCPACLRAARLLARACS